MPSSAPESELLASLPPGTWVGGMDEVGRGCIAGPVTVGLVAVQADLPPAPELLNDSKKLTPRRREQLELPLQEWVSGYAIASASPEEIDCYGIIAALRMAGYRALDQLAEQGITLGALILDGTHNWLKPDPPDLFKPVTHPDNWERASSLPQIEMLVKGDEKSSAVAAASVLAKVHRDRFMCQLEDPGYDWASNKGYGSKKHQEGLRRLGVSPWHRKSWKLPIASSE